LVRDARNAGVIDLAPLPDRQLDEYQALKIGRLRKLETLGLHDAFACILLSEEFGARKPDPSIFLEGCRQLQVEPARCLYVGDSYRNDVVGAAAAGMPCCWFNAISDPVTGSAKATIEIDRLSDLLLWLGLAAE
ncbi:MAG: HAD-IA family hydrolase, partial [Candidatus Latescibacterota bacterium]|nr:HAD-IA family hydrolase [Candidatus Latescibacterota bacterium]